ncbi:hypothetical protein [Anaeromyxobacter oryzisoli]|uniref:hypothetical protein n=1 Tax=Anaeromyxobacter oryzisoli TaxID=2925408 RepID=UPI001F585989|nr:hypothetical protein [Anaeromyxobacter sp. SG63]
MRPLRIASLTLALAYPALSSAEAVPYSIGQDGCTLPDGSGNAFFTSDVEVKIADTGTGGLTARCSARLPESTPRPARTVKLDGSSGALCVVADRSTPSLDAIVTPARRVTLQCRFRSCSELLPTFGAAAVAQFQTGTHGVCYTATASPAGQVALGIRNMGGSTWFRLFSAAGVDENVWLPNVSFLPVTDLAPWFHPTSSGYQGLVHEPGLTPPVVLRTWDASGLKLADSAHFAVSSTPSAEGGSVVIGREFTGIELGARYLDWIDASGSLTRSVPIDGAPRYLVQTAGTKHVLVLDVGLMPWEPSSPWQARWLDAHGGAITSWFTVEATAHGRGPALTPLLDGRVALFDGASWVAVFEDGEAHADAPPGWLGSRPATRLATIGRGRGYAVLPVQPGDGSSFTSRFEVLTAEGESCGSVDVPSPTPPAGESWRPSDLFVGEDGTLLELDFQSPTNPGEIWFGVHCAYRWWPALLR